MILTFFEVQNLCFFMQFLYISFICIKNSNIGMNISTFFFIILAVNRYNQYDGMSPCRTYSLQLSLSGHAWKRTPHRFDCHTHSSNTHIKSICISRQQKNISKNEKWHEVLSRAAIVVILTFMKLVFPLHPPSHFFFLERGGRLAIINQNICLFRFCLYYYLNVDTMRIC